MPEVFVIRKMWQHNGPWFVRITNICSPCITNKDATLLWNSQPNWPLIIIVMDFFNWWTGQARIVANICTCQILRYNWRRWLSSSKAWWTGDVYDSTQFHQFHTGDFGPVFYTKLTKYDGACEKRSFVESAKSVKQCTRREKSGEQGLFSSCIIIASCEEVLWIWRESVKAKVGKEGRRWACPAYVICRILSIKLDPSYTDNH